MSLRHDDGNPWLSIPAVDYESHMGSPGVLQLQFLSRAFRDWLDRYRPVTLAVVGCATGNGFEHIDPSITRTVIGIDIHPEYLALLRDRFSDRIPGLTLECMDIAACELPPRSLGLVHCALVLEYVDPGIVIEKAARWLEPGGLLSVVLQLPSPGHANVTPTEFASLARLDTVIRLVDPHELDRGALRSGFSKVESRVETLETGKPFYCAVYRLRGSSAGVPEGPA